MGRKKLLNIDFDLTGLIEIMIILGGTFFIGCIIGRGVDK